MHRKVLSFLFIVLTTFSFISAQEDSDWYYDKSIASIEFQGLKSVKKSDLNGVTSFFIDKPFTDELYSEIIDRLFALDFFDDINSYVKHDEKNPDKVLLILDVIERPIIKSISFSGNKKIRNGELRDKIGTKPSDIFVESAVLLDERAIKNYYREKGYTRANVTHTFKDTEDGVEIIFNIDEGANTVIKEIHFLGNTIVSERSLKNKLDSKEVGLFRDGSFQASAIERDKQKIIAYYRENGYADATILDVKQETEYNEDKQRNEMSITYVIQEGAQYTYTGIRISGNEVFTTDELLQTQKLKVGDIYNETKFQQDLATITSFYYENGYMSNEFYQVPKKDVDRHEISYDLKIVEHSRSHVENIIIKGNTKTKDYVIRREIPLEPGDVFSRAKVFNGLRNLGNLRYFSNVIPEPQQGSEQNLVDLVLTVEEQPTSNLNFGMSFSGVTDSNTIPISLFLKLENSNLFGEGKTVSVGTQISNTDQTLDLSYSQNWIGNQPIYFGSTLSVSHSASDMRVHYIDPNFVINDNNIFSEYQGWSIGLSTSVGRRWALDYAVLSLSGGISTSLNRNNYDETAFVPVDLGVSAFANRWGVSNAMFLNFSVDARDLSYDPSEGWFASQKLTWHGLIPKAEKEFYLRSDTKVEGYLKLLDLPVTDEWGLKLVLSGYSGLSLMFPILPEVMSSEHQLYIDGMFNGRGWNFGVGGGGNAMWSSNIELRMPVMPGMLGLDFFFDAVAVKDKVENLGKLNIEDFYFSYGPGLRFLMPQFPLHLIFAWRFKVEDGAARFEKNPFQFVLSFNIPNR